MAQQSEVPDQMKQAVALADRLLELKISAMTGIFGTSAKDQALLRLRTTATELVASIYHDEATSSQTKKLDALEGALQAAHLIELVSSDELKQYLADIDAIHAAIDKE